MRKVKLKANTKRFKQLIALHGEIWFCIAEERMKCFNNEIGFR